MTLRVEHFNRTMEALPHRLDDDRWRSTVQLLAHHSGYGPIQALAMGAGAPSMPPGLYVDGVYFDIDQIVQFLAGDTGLLLGLNSGLNNSGKGVALAEAYVASLAESYERLVGVLGSFCTYDEMIVASYDQMTAAGHDCPDPEAYPIVAPEQLTRGDCPLEAFDRGTVVGWVEAARLEAGTPTFVPAQLVYIVRFRHPDEAHIIPGISVGMAVGPTREEAIDGALLEVIERDALNLAWFSGVAPVPLDLVVLDDVDPALGRTIARSQNPVHLQWHPTDVPGVHVVSAVEAHPGYASHGLAIGSAAAMDLGAAARGALMELAQLSLRQAVSSLNSGWAAAAQRRRTSPPPDLDPRQMTSVGDGLTYYGYPSNLVRALPLLIGRSREEVAARPPPATTHPPGTVREALRAWGVDPIVIDLSLPASGFAPNAVAVVKVIVPELTYPNIPGYPKLGHPRFYDFPCHMGLTDDRLRFDQLNSMVYPYS